MKGTESTGHNDLISFEQFKKSFIDYPFLLEHFKKEYEDMVENENI